VGEAKKAAREMKSAQEIGRKGDTESEGGEEVWERNDTDARS
jgi:general stress protein YciG